MIFISAGHNSKSVTIRQDPGAVNKNGVKEGDLTIEFRDLVINELAKLGASYIQDADEESLAAYLKRIKTGSGSVVVEYHFDSAASESATGTTALIESEADNIDRMFAQELVDVIATTLGIKNRGVITEKQSHRGRLGLMREDGTICLCELGFISNPDDLAKYNKYKHDLAKQHARILKSYDDLLS